MGLYYPWHKAKLVRYDRRCTHLGEARFKCILTGTDLVITYFMGAFITAITLGLGAPWALNLLTQMKIETLAIVGDLPKLEPEKK